MQSPKRFDQIQAGTMLVKQKASLPKNTTIGGMLANVGILVPYDANFYYADVRRGSDNNSGLVPDSPKATIEACVTLMNARIGWSNSPWANRDVLVISPGTYAENLTSLPYGCVVMGMGYDLRDAQNGVKIKPASGVPIDVGSCINTTFYNIGIEALASVAAFDADICNNVQFIGVRFAGGAAETTAVGFVTKDSVATKWLGCEFVNLDKGIDVNYADGGDSFTEALIDSCLFHRIDTAGIEISTNLVGGGATVKDSDFYGGGVTMAKGIDDNSGILDLIRLTITATDPVEGCRSANACYGNGSLLNGSGE